jgi:hypothetical protein
VYHCVILELRVDEDTRKQSKRQGGVQWTYTSWAFGLAIIVRNPVGTEHLRFWDAEDEALPRGARQATVIYFTLYTTDSALHTLHVPLSTWHFTLLHSTLYTLHFTFYTLQLTVHGPNLYFTHLYALHSTLYRVQVGMR